MFRSNGHRDLNALEKILLSVSLAVRRALQPKVFLNDKGHRSVFVCETKTDAQRPAGLWLKEAGTMRWIETEVRTGDIFMDIGANIGVYSLAAAHRAGSAGRVYAFEPHKVNAVTLMRNIVQSGLGDRIELFTSPLSDEQRVLRFNYVSLASGSSGSQFGHARVAGKDRDFQPVASEIATAQSVDQLIAANAISPPSLIKIDVDGNELSILRGMQNLLKGASRPRSVQVEINVGEEQEITSFLSACGYEVGERHFTRPGEALRKRGIPVDQIAHNAIFRPKTARA